jgi:UDP-glucose 4-epimerase
VVDKLLERGHEVTVFDIMKPQRNLGVDVNHITIDITDSSNTTIALTGHYDVIYLLAAMADVNDVFKNPVEAGMVNVMGTANVLEAARRNGIPRVILASTVWVYEMADARAVNENTPICLSKANHVYTSTKMAAEMYCHSYHKLYDLNFTILRYGIPYGPRARDSIVSAIFVRKALNKEPLVIYGNGMQRRNFIYVEDLAEGNVAALKDVAKNQTYNLDGMRGVTIKEVAETVKEIIGNNVEIKYEKGRPGDYSGIVVSNEKAKRELGWEPKIDFREGMERYIAWYKECCLKNKESH